MGDVTKNISRHELRCKCGRCGFAVLGYEQVIDVVQEACDHFAAQQGVDRVTLTITSAARCTEYNRKPTNEGGPGSNDNSRHPRGDAIDHRISGVTPRELYDYYCERYPDKFGVGMYGTFVHVDTRPVKARWTL